MATSKRQPRRSSDAAPSKAIAKDTTRAATLDMEAPDTTPATPRETRTPSTGPTIAMNAERIVPSISELPARSNPELRTAADRTAQSLASERAGIVAGRVKLFGGLALLLLGVGLLGYWQFAPAAPTSQAPVAQVPVAQVPTAVPTAQPAPAQAVQAPIAQAPTAAPTAQPTPAPALQTNPTVAPQPAGGTCPAIAGLPVYTGAVCVEQESDQDDGVTKLENTYSVNAPALDVQRFYESAFAPNGWTLQDFTYAGEQGQRALKVEVEAEQGPNGVFAKIKLTERGAPAAAGNSCSAIAGLPVYPSATCTKFDTDQDDGVIKVENTYTAAASPDEVRRFYENAFAQAPWAELEFTYDIVQGPRHLTIDVDTQPAPSGVFTQFKIAEK
jgi:hypothetical protein